MDVGHLARYTDLVAVEVVGLLADFSVFVDRVSIGETTCARTALTLRLGGFILATTCCWVSTQPTLVVSFA